MMRWMLLAAMVLAVYGEESQLDFFGKSSINSVAKWDGLVFGDYRLFLAQVLNCEVPLSAGSQKENFQVLVEETLGEECNYETIKNIHENLNEMIQEQKGNPEPVTIDKTEMRDLLEKSGVKEERLQDFEEHFEQAVGENTRLMAANIAETRKFEVKTPDVVVKVNPERTDLVETMEIEGKQYLVIQIDEHLEVNGISVNPETGEVQYNE